MSQQTLFIVFYESFLHTIYFKQYRSNIIALATNKIVLKTKLIFSRKFTTISYTFSSALTNVDANLISSSQTLSLLYCRI